MCFVVLGACHFLIVPLTKKPWDEPFDLPHHGIDNRLAILFRATSQTPSEESHDSLCNRSETHISFFPQREVSRLFPFLAEIVKHALYHWDGPGALVHTDDLLATIGLHSLSYVPGAGYGNHIDYLDLFKRVQEGGKAVQVHGSPEEIKFMHRELQPEKAFYCTNVRSQAEAEELLAWFVKNT